MEYDVDSRLTWIWVTRSLRGSRGVRAHVIEEGACPYKRVNEMPLARTQGIVLGLQAVNGSAYFRLLSGVRFTCCHAFPDVVVGGTVWLSGMAAKFSFLPPRGPTS